MFVLDLLASFHIENLSCVAQCHMAWEQSDQRQTSSVDFQVVQVPGEGGLISNWEVVTVMSSVLVFEQEPSDGRSSISPA